MTTISLTPSKHKKLDSHSLYIGSKLTRYYNLLSIGGFELDKTKRILQKSEREGNEL